MKSRVEAARLVHAMFDGDYESITGRPSREKGQQSHIGKQEFRELLDYIYEGEPESNSEMIKGEE